MKKGIFFLAVILLMASGSFVLGQNEKKLKNWHKEEVNHIITKSEAAEFRKLKKEEDREFYTELFWAKRDPTPTTKKNEFKEKYYQRKAHVEETFRYGYKGPKLNREKFISILDRPKFFSRVHPPKSLKTSRQTKCGSIPFSFG